MKDFLLYILSAFLLIVLQAVLFKGVKPDLILVLVCLFSLKYGNTKGVAFGAVAGLMADSASGFIIGPNIISKSLAAFLINHIRRQFFTWNSLLCTVVIIGIAAIDLMFVYFFIKTFSRMSPATVLSKAAMLQVIYTAAGSFLFYHIIRPDKDDMPKEDRFKPYPPVY